MKTQARYIKVKNHILDGIRELRWCEGDRVSSENELANVCDVSRMTARRALKELTNEGVLYSKQGQGTFVASAKSRSSVMTLKNIATEIHERNHQHSSKIICLEVLDDSEIANQLGWNTEQPIYFSRIVHFENDIAIQLEERFVNPILAPDYLKQNFQQLTPNEYLTTVCPVSEADHLVEAVMPSVEQSSWLAMSVTQPCLKLTRTTWSDDQIASFALLYHPGDRYQLGSHITIKDSMNRNKRGTLQ